MAEIQTGETTVDNYLESIVDDLPIQNSEKNAIKNVIGIYRVESERRQKLKAELNSLGKGTGFHDVEKLSQDITAKELELFNTKEEIRQKTEAMQTEKALDHAELGEMKDGLRTLKQQCEQEYKNRKKELDNELKQEQHRLSIDEEKREKADMNKGDWKEHVKKVLTKELQDAIPLKLEALHEKQQKNIEKLETQIQTNEEAILIKYGACEEEIRELNNRVKIRKIKLHSLEMARENRLEFAGINNKEIISGDTPQRDSKKEKIKVI